MPTAPVVGAGGCRALHDGGWGLSPEASAKGETRVTSNESRVTKMPRWGILLFLAETKGLFRCASSPCKIVRTHNQRTPVRLFAAVRTLAPRVRIHIIKHNKKSRPYGRNYLLWRCGNNLRRTPYNKIQGLTGNFDGFGDHIFTHRAQFPRLLQKFTQK